ncbi:MAG: hypothetical protein PF638_03410 [Candidatus Delongbacteria bacterium]|jgi:hypothetical protein|nr:hypothetical protein [Candidatus Delongbacteria bacterium]
MLKKLIYVGLILSIIFISGCDVKNGTDATEIELPLDNELTLYSENVGLYPDKSILDDPNNPYADASLNMENVWDLNDECPSPKAKFYLWATVTAKFPTGEHQYYTALSLHELYTAGGSLNAKEQAIKAYRSVLDHFFDSTTWFLADWLGEETYYPVILRDMVGRNLYDPSEFNYLPFYNDPAFALQDIGEWGYVYDQEAGKLSRYQ